MWTMLSGLCDPWLPKEEKSSLWPLPLARGYHVSVAGSWLRPHTRLWGSPVEEKYVTEQLYQAKLLNDTQRFFAKYGLSFHLIFPAFIEATLELPSLLQTLHSKAMPRFQDSP